MKLWKTAAAVCMATVLLAGCDDPDDVMSLELDPGPGPDPDPVATSLMMVSGDGQSGVVDQSVSNPLVVEVRDDNDDPMSGVPITWTADPGTQFVSTDDTTGSDGRAAAVWRMSTTTGNYSAQAQATPGSVTFSATATPDSPSQIEMVSGDGQTATSGSDAPDPLVVRVRDQFSNLIPGAMVSWSPSHSGAANPGSVATAGDGSASTVWTMGCPATDQTVTAAAGVASADFSGTASVGLPAVVAKVSGDNQVGLLGLVLADDIVVRVEDACGNPIVGATVNFTVTSALGGSAIPLSAVTNASGEASTTWLLGITLGDWNLEATVAGSLLATLFTATAVP